MDDRKSRDLRIVTALALAATVVVSFLTGALFYVVTGVGDSVHGIAGIPDFVDSIISTAGPATEGELSQRQLFAQEAMSVWAFWLFVVSAISVFVTTIGTIALLKQISLTRQIVEESEKTTRAAQDGNHITKDLAERQLRAYLYPATGSLSLKARSYAFSCRISVPFKNTGKTPATLIFYKLRSSISSAWVTTQSLGDRSAEPISEVKTNIQKIVGPDQETYLSIVGSVTPKHFSAIDAASKGRGYEGVEFELYLEWHYRDYLDRIWQVTAVFTSDRIEHAAHGLQTSMRQKSAKERQLR